MKKGLYIVATPIGNLGDVSLRAQETLSGADIIACEDTRVTKKLFSLLGLGLNKKFITLHDHNEEEHSQVIIDSINNGAAVALVSDAGSPLISDPGYKLIRQCRKENIDICAIPGCCALICALQLSGLPTNKFMFAGFIPNKEKARNDLFSSLKNIDATLIFYETAPRILKTLTTALDVFGNREMSVVREITKVYEETLTGTATELIDILSSKEVKGEIVFIVAPPCADDDNLLVDIEDILRHKLQKQPLKTAVKEIVAQYKLNKNDVYAKALEIKNEND